MTWRLVETRPRAEFCSRASSLFGRTDELALLLSLRRYGDCYTMGGSIRRFSAASRSSPVTRPLTSLLVGEQLSPNTRLEGTVVQVIPYDVSARTSALAIVQDNRRVKIVLRGSWSMAAPDYFRTKLNRPVRIIADGGETVTVVSQQRDRNGDVVWGGNQLGISFENGFRGYWRNEITRAKEPFAFKSESRSHSSVPCTS